ncbi:Ig-like domain-containing protein [Catenovulum maritimum]|uniref:Ig-like domain-containing protein n=1 Tax=Catenovulum maritimum TaxID=1513271 RepID=UPI000ADDDED6|nr:Ig-like domain-containing protein [Catenovulum maritimum]
MFIQITALSRLNKILTSCSAGLILLAATTANASVTLESSTKIADNALHFDGSDIDTASPKLSTQELKDDTKYHFKFGGNISAHGDSIKVYKQYVFMTWYRGGKDDRHVMLSRLDTNTGIVKTIEFPHQHNGFQGNWWIGESHNTIGLAISPKNGTIHMVYDLHAYDDNSIPNAKFDDDRFKDDFFRYSYSLPGAAEVADDDFTLEKQFVKDTSSVSTGPDDYKHLTMSGDLADKRNFSALTYPKFFETQEGELLHFMRWGGNNNGAYYYNSYDADAQKWSLFEAFNHRNQKSHGQDYNWGLYGEMKYVNGKLRVGFQRRSSNNNDKFIYQNGIYYAYLDDPANNIWRDHTGKQITWPLVDADEIKIYEPGDLVDTTQANKVHIVGNFDWTVTDKGDIHIIHRVKDNENNKTVYGHLYKPAGATDFIHAPGITGASEINAIGDDVYIIGLENKKPYIEVAKGGTTQFSRIYTDITTTTNFQHGVSHAKGGKVYYYLMEAASGAARPLHLQVIDLGLSTTSVVFEQSALTVVKDYSSLNITTTASSTDSSVSVNNVALYIDNQLVSTLNGPTFKWSEADTQLQSLAVGSYALKAIATDSAGDTAEALMTLIVVEPTPTISFTESELTLLKNYNSLSITVNAATPDVTRTITGVDLYLDDQLVSNDASSPYEWTQASTQLSSLDVGEYTLKAKVTDSQGDTAETSIKLTVIDPTPSVSFPEGDVTVEEGYTSLKLNVAADSPVDDRSIAKVELFVNNTLIRQESVAPYDWGHNETLKAELLGFPVGTHTLKAIATDSEGVTAEASAQLIVQEKLVAPSVSFTQGTQTVTEGYTSLTFSVNAATSMASRNIKHVALYINDVLISEDTAAPYEWTQASSALSALSVGTYTIKAVATDSGDMTAQTSAQLTVQETLIAPTISFTKGTQTVTEGYSSLAFSVDAATSMTTRNIKHVALYINNVLVSEDTAAPYQWTQASSGLSTLSAGTYTVKAVVTDSGDATAQTTATLTVEAKPAETTPPDSNDSAGNESSGGSTSPLVMLFLTLVALGRRYR